MSGVVVVAENGKGRYQQAVTLGQHQLIVGEQHQRLLEIANKCPTHRALAQSMLLDCALAT